MRDLMGYEEEELKLFDTKRFWHDLDHRAQIIGRLRDQRRPAGERGGDLEDQTGATPQLTDLLRPSCLSGWSCRLLRWEADWLGIRHHAA